MPHGLLQVIMDYCAQNEIQFNEVRKVFSGGGAIFLDFINDMKKTFPNSEIVTLYGSTEAEPIAELNVKEIGEDEIKKMQSGYGLLAGNIVGVEDCRTIKFEKKEIGEISKQEFNELQTEDVGEIVVTGKNVLKGYVGGIGDAENKFSVEGVKYHRTGDLGIFDEKGRLWLRGRIKTPYFGIESALHSKFKLKKIAVLEIQGKIILVLEKNNNISEQELKNAIEFAQIKEVKYVKKIPVDKRHNTKVDYNELRKVLKI